MLYSAIYAMSNDDSVYLVTISLYHSDMLYTNIDLLIIMIMINICMLIIINTVHTVLSFLQLL